MLPIAIDPITSQNPATMPDRTLVAVFVAPICACVVSGLSGLSGCTPRDEQPGPEGGSGVAIVLDGATGDWSDIEAVVDDAGDAPGAEVDIGAVRVTADGSSVYFLIDLGREVNVQVLDGFLELALDADGDPATGARRRGLDGVDISVRFTAPAREPGRSPGGVAVMPGELDGEPELGGVRGHAAVGLVIAPTHASRTIELRMRRGSSLPGTRALFAGSELRARLAALTADGRVVDETEVFSRSLGPVEPLAAPRPVTPPPRTTGALRLVTWNVEFGSLLRKPHVFARALNGIDPEVILLQEMTDGDSAAAIESFLNERVPRRDSRWTALFGSGGGPLRCAIASRLPLRPVEELSLIPYPDRPDRELRVLGAAVTAGPQRLLVVSIHLRCCGRIGSPEDETRLVEATLINDAVRRALERSRFDGVVVAGDVNLVGGPRPLELLLAGADVDGSDLQVLHPLRLDGRDGTTWADPRLPFVPGRLDYVLVSDGALPISGAWVIDTPDALLASDHAPIVVDVELE